LTPGISSAGAMQPARQGTFSALKIRPFSTCGPRSLPSSTRVSELSSILVKVNFGVTSRNELNVPPCRSVCWMIIWPCYC
jgi:hypothetical protein